MRRRPNAREWLRIDAALARAVAFGFRTAQLSPDFRERITVETMNRCFTKYHLGHGFALHRFTGVHLGPPHDHPGKFTTLILEPYVEEIYTFNEAEWTSTRMTRHAGSTHTVAMSTVHQIVSLPAKESWTLVRFGRHVQPSRVYRFGEGVEAREWRRRQWRPVLDANTSPPQPCPFRELASEDDGSVIAPAASKPNGRVR